MADQLAWDVAIGIWVIALTILFVASLFSIERKFMTVQETIDAETAKAQVILDKVGTAGSAIRADIALLRTEITAPAPDTTQLDALFARIGASLDALPTTVDPPAVPGPPPAGGTGTPPAVPGTPPAGGTGTPPAA